MLSINEQNDAQNGCQMETNDNVPVSGRGHGSGSGSKVRPDKSNLIDENFNLSNIKVTVGIDEDLRMILEMDPSIVDLGVDVIGCTPATISPCHTPKSYGLPPILGG